MLTGARKKKVTEKDEVVKSSKILDFGCSSGVCSRQEQMAGLGVWCVDQEDSKSNAVLI